MREPPAALRLLFRGSDAALARALDVILVRGAVTAVREGDGELEVALSAPLRVWPDALRAVEVEALPDDEPASTGLEDDAPVCVGERIVVRPPWVAAPSVAADVVEIVVPRGMAFGSGEHASTQAALLTLERLWPAPPPGVCLDVGTGSGILARYCQLRGTDRVLACDVEVASVAAATALLPGADVRLGGPEVFAPAMADLVVANLDGDQLRAGLAGILARWNGRGPLCLSGMRPDRGEDAAVADRVGRAADHRQAIGEFVALGYGAGV